MDDTMSPSTEGKSVDAPAIGIDLGTSKCCVGVVREGKVTIIENERGSKTTPSYVAFTKTMRIVGEDAKNQASQNPANTVFGVKRIIGRNFDDPSLKDIKDKSPFTVKQEDGKPRIEVSYKENTIDLSPEQVSAMLLTKMKHIAESHLGCEVTDAVISVPAYFTNSQRQATKDAAAIAGLNVLGLINEPTAAALAYWDNMGPTDETICVVDLGGGKLDVSIITLNANDGIRVEQTMGDTTLGGMDFDQQLVDHFIGEFRGITDQNVSKKGLERVRLACEKLKHKLSLLPSAKIQLECLATDTNFESSVDRRTFEDLCLKDLSSFLRKALQCTKFGSKEERVMEFTKVVGVGGSTRIPLFQEILKDVLDKSLDKSVNPDEAVAHGAAIKAALLAGDRFLKEVQFQEVAAHAIEMETGHFRDNVIQQNSHETRKLFTPPPELHINDSFTLYENVYNAERDNKESHFLGSVKLSDLSKPLFPSMVFSLDDSGIFSMNIVVDKNEYSVPFNSDCLNSDQLTKLRFQEKDFQADEENEKVRLVLLNNLSDNCYCLKNRIEELGFDGDSEKKENMKFIDFCDETIDWLDCSSEATKDMCESKNKELQDLYNALEKTSKDVNKIESNEETIPSVDNTNTPSETTQMSAHISTKNNPKLSNFQSKESLGEEEDVQVNRLNKQDDEDAGDKQTLQHGGDPADGYPRTFVEYFHGSENENSILDQTPFAPNEVPVLPQMTSLDSISITNITSTVNDFSDESTSNVDSEASDAQGSCSLTTASPQVKQQRSHQIRNNLKKIVPRMKGLRDKLSREK